MPRIAVTVKPVGSIGAESKLWCWSAPNTTVPTEMSLPTGTLGVSRRPSWAIYNQGGRSRMYGVGGWTANVLLDEQFRVLRQGIPAPTVVPTVAATTGPGPTGTAICYLRFKDRIGQRVSPMSAPSASFALANQARAWSAIPTTCPDPSVDAIEGLVSMDGALARVAWERDLGVTTVTEAVATGALGEAAPDDFADMPAGRMNVIYNDSQWIAGNEKYPERIYKSALGEPERYEGTYLQTDGEPIVGAFVSNTNLFFGSRKRIYRATGFDETDLVRDIEKPDVGLVNHDGIAGAHGKVIVPTPLGIFLYAGEWIPLLNDRESEWQREYKLWRADYEDAEGFFDPVDNVYLFGPVEHSDWSGLWVHWVLDCQRIFPELGATSITPCWANDVRTRKTTGHAVMVVPGSSQPVVMSGSSDGVMRFENESDAYAYDEDDDKDTYKKRITIEPASIMPDSGGGVQTDGCVFHLAWTYVECEYDEWTAEFRAGGEWARKAQDPDVSDVTPASLLVDDLGDGDTATAEPETRHPHVLEGCAGDVLALKLTVESPTRFRFWGWGGTCGLGVRSRGYVVVNISE